MTGAVAKKRAATPGDRTTDVGGELVRRLGRFIEKLESSDDIAARFTCRTVRLQLSPGKLGAADVKRVRGRLGASQAIFAQFLGVSRGAVRDWEQGLKPPSGAARRLMDEIDRNPEYFSKRLAELSAPAVRRGDTT